MVKHLCLRPILLAFGLLSSASNAAPGYPDPAFGTSGRVIVTRGSTDLGMQKPALQADGKWLLPLSGPGRMNSLGGVARLNANGSLDTSFGFQGLSYQGETTAVAASGSDIYVAIRIPNSGDHDYVYVSRLDSAGVVDQSFGTSGTTPDFNAGFSGGAASQILEAIAVAPDGKIVAAGWTYATASRRDVMVVRFTAAGALDATFGTGGIFKHNPFGADALHEVTSLALLADGSVVVSGSNGDPGTHGFVLKVTSAGVLDSTFGSGGIHQVTGASNCPGLTPDGTGFLVACSVGGDFHVSRLTSAGVLDAGFTVTTYNAGSSEDIAADVLRLPSGKIVLSGLGNGKFTLVGVNQNGGIDTTFGTAGMYQDSAAASIAYARAARWNGSSIDAVGMRLNPNSSVVVAANLSAAGVENSLTTSNVISDSNYFRVKALSSGQMIAAGSLMQFDGLEGRFNAQLSRYNSNGTLDGTFGAGGHSDLPFEKLAFSGLRDFAILPSGKFVITGDFNKPGDPQFGYVGVGQALAAGGIDLSFNAAGTPGYNRVVIGAPFTRNLKVQSDGKIVVTGASNPPAPTQFGVVRFNADGTLDTGYGSSGLARSAFASNANPRYVALDASDRAVVVGNFSGTIGLARFTSAGVLDSTFGTSGQVNHALPPGTTLSLPNKIEVLPDGRLLIGFSGWTASNGVIGFLRLNANGTIDGGFGVNGFATMAIGLTTPNNPNLWDMVVTPNGRVTGTLSYSLAAGQPRRATLIRFNPDGTLDTSFGDGGSVLYDEPTVSLELLGIDIFPNGALAAAGSTGVGSFSRGVVVRTVADPSAVLPFTTTSVISSLNPSVVGQAVTFTATVTGGPGSPTGTVNFRSGAATLAGCGAVALSAGQAACTTSALPAGNFSITAQYSGDASRLGGTSASLSQIVNASGGVGRRLDFHGDLKADILWRQNTTGENYLYPMDGRTILASEGNIRSVPIAWVAATVIDFDGDGKADILWRNTTTGENYVYPMDGRTIKATEGFIRSVSTSWIVAGSGDFDGDGKGDILWRNTSTGENYIYFMDGRTIKATEGFIRSVPTDWSVAGVGDFDGDGKADILWRKSSTGENYIYFMDGRTIKATEGFIRNVASVWAVAGVGDFDGDGKTDILWRNTSTGENYMYPMDGRTIKATEGFIRSVPTVWIAASVGDFDGDTKADILWRNTSTGENYIYPMDGRTIKATEGFIRSVPTSWSVVSK